MSRKQASLIMVLTILCLVLGFLISGRLWFRLDLTRNKAYTISKVSRELHQEIPDQVRITYYISDKLAQVHPLPGEIADLLQEYAAYSQGKIRFVKRDPSKAGLLEAIEQMGIQPQQIRTVEQDQSSVAMVYTGISIEYLDSIDVLPVVFSLATLEYDLTSRIRALIRGRDRECGVIIGDGDRQWERDYGIFAQSLEQSGYNVRLIPPGDEIPDTLPYLFVLGGVEDMDDWALYRIDRYIRLGGKVLFALDGVHINTAGALEGRVMEDKGLLGMVSHYGARVKPELALDQAALTVPFQTGRQVRFIRYPFWISAQGQGGNPNHPVTAQFGGLDFFWPSPLELNPPQGVEAEILVNSSPQAWLMTRDFNANPESAYLYEREQEESLGTKTLAASLSGVFPSWFEGRPKPVREGSSEELPDMGGAAKASRIIVLGDRDLAGSFTQVNQSQQRNMDFLFLCADWLGNDDDIIGIRNRQGGGRLDKISDPEKREAAMAFSRIINVYIIPILVIALGFFMAWKRRSRAVLKAGVSGVPGASPSPEGAQEGVQNDE